MTKLTDKDRGLLAEQISPLNPILIDGIYTEVVNSGDPDMVVVRGFNDESVHLTHIAGLPQFNSTLTKVKFLKRFKLTRV